MVARGVILTTFAFICFAISKHDCLHDSLLSISNQNQSPPIYPAEGGWAQVGQQGSAHEEAVNGVEGLLVAAAVWEAGGEELVAVRGCADALGEGDGGGHGG